ncbi:choline/ethanolamine kinase-like [Oppia nitens]|uniref:choline/ethanolamine kinase-like n=1 Tax=Oppia nitens TaxID=1686743 RepID=UPI0023DC78A6|nr:choline/ethanolamine kinase-like [Oppia nitens]
MNVDINANNENVSKETKNIEDISSIEELDMENMNLYRGETPIDIKNQCLKICKDYLSGEWIQQTVDTITVTRITGGLTNQIYYCGINEPNQTSNVPQEVAVRFYGEKHIKNSSDNYERLPDVIIDLMVSETKLGPKVYAIFEHGQLQKYYKHRQFKPEEQNNPKLVDEVFRKLARIHAMNVPINRTFNWMTTELDGAYKLAFEGSFDVKSMFEKYNCETLLTADMKSEVQFINELVVKANSPLVFTHNDFRSSNLLITESVDKSDGPIVVCDFEYGSYGYRGMDFMPILREWGRKQLDFSVDGIPHEDSVIRPLIEIYVDECHRIYGEEYSANTINSKKADLLDVCVGKTV